MNAIELGATIEEYKRLRIIDADCKCAITAYKLSCDIERLEQLICEEIFGKGWLDQQRKSDNDCPF